MRVDVVFRDGAKAMFSEVDVVTLYEPGKPTPEPDAGLLVLVAPAVLAYQVYNDEPKADERRFPVRE
jgi:hypothetical protein